MVELQDLIARLEKVSGPDRELDHWIQATQNAANILAVFTSLDAWVREAVKCNWATPRYTASLDAALTLVPEGNTIYMTFRAAAPARFWACTPPQGLGGPQSSKRRRHLEAAVNSNEAIALTIAALKARQSLQSEGRE